MSLDLTHGLSDNSKIRLLDLTLTRTLQNVLHDIRETLV